MAADDLDLLSSELHANARVEEDGEVMWHINDARSKSFGKLADAKRVVLGLDICD